MTTAPTPHPRYGARRGGGWRWWAIAGGVLAVAALVWVAWGQLQPRAEGTIVAYEVRGDSSAQLLLEVSKPAGTGAVCTIEALGDGFAQAGLLQTRVEVSAARVVQVDVEIATSQRASALTVRGCDPL